ncbi:MAG: quinolinate synthase NadA, partial [Kiritimatiellae bacterium]|nr:quinolinate synthase NadA [Kiritimatiellia bacterium]
SMAVLRHADARGYSLELARAAAANPDAERIVFCGVHFMAESADILTGGRCRIYMPDTTAGCPMADMAPTDQVLAAWNFLQSVSDDWLPVVYVNSSAEIKAFCGRHGGTTCTSSNCGRAFRWVLDQNKRIFFLPDQHLGRNTADDIGLEDTTVLVYDPRLPSGGLTKQDLHRTRLVLWKGFCPIHQAFSIEQIREVRATLPDAKIIVHPECRREVVRAADAHGSTAQIVRYVENAPTGSTIVIGTELNLVRRLAEEHRTRVTVKALCSSVCANMAKTNEENLLDVLRNWPEDLQVHVPEETARDALKALERMLQV